MDYDISISPTAIAGYEKIPNSDRAGFRKFIHQRLSSDAMNNDYYTIKCMLGIRGIRYPLIIGEAQVFYDVTGPLVEILLIILSFDTVITRQGRPIALLQRIPIALLQSISSGKLDEADFQNKIESSRQLIWAGQGILFHELPD